MFGHATFKSVYLRFQRKERREENETGPQKIGSSLSSAQPKATFDIHRRRQTPSISLPLPQQVFAVISTPRSKATAKHRGTQSSIKYDKTLIAT
jgi:hypothetical protein